MTLLHVLCIMIVSSSLKEHAAAASAVNDDDEDSRLGCEDRARGREGERNGKIERERRQRISIIKIIHTTHGE